jgi:hypothetical protein
MKSPRSSAVILLIAVALFLVSAYFVEDLPRGALIESIPLNPVREAITGLFYMVVLISCLVSVSASAQPVPAADSADQTRSAGTDCQPKIQ